MLLCIFYNQEIKEAFHFKTKNNVYIRNMRIPVIVNVGMKYRTS